MKGQTENNSSSQFLNTDGGKTKSNSIEIPSISLPKGGGAIKGIDEKFSVNAVNGTASFSIPLPFSPARGASPSLSLSYNSGAGNGIFGLGWNLSLASIKRKTDKGLPQYFNAIESDTFLFSDAEDLVPEFKKKTDGSFALNKGDYIINEKYSLDGLFTIRFYKPRTEGLFARIERWSEIKSGKIKWRIITKDNTTTLFGWSDNSRIFDPLDNTRIFEWLPEFVFDDKGNSSQYIYKEEDKVGFEANRLHNKNRIKKNLLTYTNRYLDRILYGNKAPYKKFGDDFPVTDNYLFETVFDYGTLKTNDSPEKINTWDFRTDAFSNYKAGFEIRTTRLCKRVLLFHHFKGPNECDGLVKSLNIKYYSPANKDFTFLKSITSYGYIKKAGGYSQKNLPPTEFTYQKHDWNSEVKTISTENLVHAPVGLDEGQYQFTDLFNEGLSGILTEQASGWYYKHNLGNGEFENAKLVSPKPSFAGLGSQLQLADLDANGGKQLVNYSTEPKGFFELGDDNEWQPFKNFQTLPNITLNDANTRMLDLNGDGKADVLISDDNVFTWYESAGKNGFKYINRTAKPYDEEAGPNIVFADSTQSIFLADMSGDGLSDIVRIRNGEVCYWPNLGFGKFGTKVGMDNAPWFDHPDAFNPSYLRLADIDGSGTTDIVYLGKNKFSCWSNLSGNSFTKIPFEMDAFPEIHNLAKVTVTDLLGNGVACIVWSSNLAKDANAPLKYIDLMNSKKPYIMVGYKNNLGKEVSMEYKPSTYFYIEDKQAGKPWVTKLHFPVHCIVKTETLDKISGYNFVSKYKYHHGYYDHAEREFRGFGMVEQTDTEDFESWKKIVASNKVDDEKLHQPPVISKTWTHTGAFLGIHKILNQFEHEYWFEEMKRKGFDLNIDEYHLPAALIIDENETDLIAGNELSVQDWQEALRACKGVALRSEVFSKDSDLKKQLTPYSVATHNCIIQRLQPRGKNQHAIFIVKESENITYSYERSLFQSKPGALWVADPRIAHNLNIKFDDIGNVLEAASIVYPRKIVNATLPQVTRDAQNETYITYVENKFTNDIDDRFLPGKPDAYRLRLVAEVKTYQLKGVPITGNYYSIENFTDILSNTRSSKAEYHELDKPLAINKSQKRLIEHIRTIYRNNDLVVQLPLGVMDSLGITHESCQLVYTKELLHEIYNPKKTDSDLVDLMVEGKFVSTDSDAKWWIPSGTTNFIDYTNTDANTLVKAQARFYLPISYTDPYSYTTKVSYDNKYHLYINETEDALGNKSSVDLFSFRTLSPQRMKDINDNLSEVISDELGLVKAMVVMGKDTNHDGIGEEADDLTFLTELTNDTEQLAITDFFASANAIGVCDSNNLQTKARDLLKHATVRFVYDFTAYAEKGKPAVVVSIVREQHFKANPDSPMQLGFEYSNGLGNVIMKKVQAEPGKAIQVEVDTDNTVTINLKDTSNTTPKHLRWIGTGRTILNNKGNPVKQYEPFFSVSPKFEDEKELVETGVTPIMCYDAVSRLIKTEMPDGTFSKVEFDSWQQTVYDANDNVLESEWYNKRKTLPANNPERIAADKAAAHDNTPSELHFDTLGRPVLQVENNGKDVTNKDILYKTKIELDIEGNLRKVTDARGNTVMEYKYDMLGNKVYQKSMDAGEHWTLTGTMANPIYSSDSRSNTIKIEYDKLHRPTKTWLNKPGIATALLVGLEIYGENITLNGKTDIDLNLRGRVFKHYDQSGCITNTNYDFKANLLTELRSLTKETKTGGNYQTEIDWNVTITETLLEAEFFEQTTGYDAMNRMEQLNSWHNAKIPASTYLPDYNERGLLTAEKLYIRGDIKPVADENYIIKAISYDAKGQKEKITYGNKTVTSYSYDEKTFHLINLKTTGKIVTDDNPAEIKKLQDLKYIYDPVGNIIIVTDDAQQKIFFRNTQILPHCYYEYDALYRLVKARGREHNGQNAIPPDPYDSYRTSLDHPNDGNAMGNYTEYYEYDSVGNILKVKHINTTSATQNWIRQYQYELTSNRLLATVGSEDILKPYYTNSASLPELYNYNAHGSMIAMPHLQQMDWDFNEHLQHIVKGTQEAWYRYDSQKQRTRKIVEHNVIKEERIYLGGLEIYRKWKSLILEEENETIQLSDGSQRMILIEHISKSLVNTIDSILISYQYSNHLGSACLEINEKAEIISYEEYHPYGTTAYQAKNKNIQCAAKRYRYTGMERDEESGLNYHSARYYAPWLGRWINCDPFGIKGGINVFMYVHNNPLNSIDRTGEQAKPATVNEDQRHQMVQDIGDGDRGSSAAALGVIFSNWLLEHIKPNAEDIAAVARNSKHEIVMPWLAGRQKGTLTNTPAVNVQDPQKNLPANISEAVIVPEKNARPSIIVSSSGTTSTPVPTMQPASVQFRIAPLPNTTGTPPPSLINPRLTNRLQAWKAYQAGGGTLDLKRWVSATQRQYGGVSGGYKSGFAASVSGTDKATHGNSLSSDRTNFLYELYDDLGGPLKPGITDDPIRRQEQYRSAPYYFDRDTGQGCFLFNPTLSIIDSGSRRQVSWSENIMYTVSPGPASNESGAGVKR